MTVVLHGPGIEGHDIGIVAAVRGHETVRPRWRGDAFAGMLAGWQTAVPGRVIFSPDGDPGRQILNLWAYNARQVYGQPARWRKESIMSTVMNELHQDHQNIREILRLLSRELDEVSDASGGDFELMRDIMIYMTRYPDHTHHPKEDLMFKRMRERGIAPETEATIAKLLREHAALAEKGSIFRDMLIGVVDGALVERDTLVATGRDYTEFLGYHARLEDETVFLVAQKLLDDADWTVVRQAFEAQVDPIFGPAVDHEFENLYDHIRDSSS